MEPWTTTKTTTIIGRRLTSEQYQLETNVGVLYLTTNINLYIVMLCMISCIYNLIKNSQAVKKGAAPKKAMVKKDVKSKMAAKKWL